MFKSKKRKLKNPNGYGSVVFLGKTRRRPWAIRKSFRDTEGKLKRKYIEFFETQIEAERFLQSMNINPISDNYNITLGEVYQEWSLIHYPKVSQNMKWNYEAARKHLVGLEKQKFKDLRTAHFQEIIDNATKTVTEKTTNKNGKTVKKSKQEPLSVSSKHKIKVLLTQLYSYAIQNDIVDKNYAEFITLPKKEKTEKEIFTDLEIKTLENNSNIEWVDSILILIYTGLRINEMLNLTKFNVDLKKDTIKGGLKTDAGKNRVVPINPKIKKFIEQRCSHESEFLFIRDNGEKIDDKYYRKYIYYPLLENLGIPRKTPHSTRHTCATLLARNGADTNAIKLILGHTDYAFTADTYTHENIDDLKKAINLI